jgi:hypothetical protein
MTTYKKSKDPWLVKVFGGPKRGSFEISVVRKSNKFGRESYGWFSKNKLVVSQSGSFNSLKTHPIIWNKLIKAARETADELNREESYE